jgi:hypothetical protein
MIDAFLRLVKSDHLTPAPERPTPLCACGQPATVYVNSIPMCGRCGLAAMQQTGR